MRNNKFLKTIIILIVVTGILASFYMTYIITYFIINTWELDQMEISETATREKMFQERKEETEKYAGHYIYEEHITETDIVEYRIEIYNDRYADISVNGKGVNLHIQATPYLNYDTNELEILFYKNLSVDSDRKFENREVLLKFKKVNGVLLTYWEAIQPQLEKNSVSGEVYFRQLPFNTRVIDTYKLNNIDISNNYSAYDEEFLQVNVDKDVFINISYPRFTEISNLKIDSAINEHIYEKALEPFNEIIADEKALENINLDVNYEVTYCNEDLLSVKFEGYIYDTTTGNGVTRIYSTNIDLDTGREIEFDILFNKSMYKIISPIIFKNDDTIAKDADELNISKLFADNRDNFEYFYFTPNKFYIILPIKGDCEFSANYITLDKYINYENEIWQNFIIK